MINSSNKLTLTAIQTLKDSPGPLAGNRELLAELRGTLHGLFQANWATLEDLKLADALKKDWDTQQTQVEHLVHQLATGNGESAPLVDALETVVSGHVQWVNDQLTGYRMEQERQITRLKSDMENVQQMQFHWAGNLGKWEMLLPSGEIQVNPLKYENLGYTPDDFKMHYKSFTELLHPEDYEAVMQNMRDHLMGKIPAYECEYRIRHRDGHYKWYLDRGILLDRHDDGSPHRVVGIVFDVSRQKEIIENLEHQKQQLTALNQQKNELLGVAAHDLRSPLTVIKMYADFLLDEMVPEFNIPDPAAEGISHIQKQSAFMLDLLNEVLDISKIESGKLVTKCEPLEYLEVVNTSLAINEQIATAKSITIQQLASETEMPLHSDRLRIIQLLNNLLSNAIKFSNKNTVITVRINASEEKIVTTVIDQGLGIPEAEIEKLFKPFSTTSVQPTSNEKSSGLGLAICKKIVEQLGGEISVQSRVGNGTTFSFTLPRQCQSA